MKLADVYPAIAVVVIFVFVVTLLISFIGLSQRELPDIRVSASRGNPEKDKLGELIWTVYNRWEKDVVVFYDYGFDGTLNSVGDHEAFVEPNSLDWKVWAERYSQIRQEYITGEKPKSPQ